VSSLDNVFYGKRQHSERKWGVAPSSPCLPRFAGAYAACSSAHTSVASRFSARLTAGHPAWYARASNAHMQGGTLALSPLPIRPNARTAEEDDAWLSDVPLHRL
jgi:hypothetical protein